MQSLNLLTIATDRYHDTLHQVADDRRADTVRPAARPSKVERWMRRQLPLLAGLSVAHAAAPR